MKNLKISDKIILGLIITGAAGAIGSCTGKESRHKRPPNIVLINVDDLGWTDATCMGSDYYETPNINRLSGEGIRFTNYYAACALSSPTRASMMTGRYPSRVGITDWIRAGFQPGGKIPSDGKNPWGYELAEGKDREYLTPKNPLWMELDEVTIAEVLKSAGYTTCHIGKWHLGSEGYYPENQGFDINIGGCDYGEPPSYFDPYTRGSIPQLGYDTIPNIPTLSSRKPGEYLTDRLSWEALNFIRKHKDETFFLNMCHYAVHIPLQAKDSLVAKYQSKGKGRHKTPVYAAMIEEVDNAVGRIVNILDSLGLSENTILVFTSDNGGLTTNNVTSNYPLRSGKAFPYEGGIRVPLIVKWPHKIAPGTLSSEMLCSIDLFPTLCEAANKPVPDSLTIDGISFLPLLTNEGKFIKHDALIWHYPHYRDWDQTIPYSIIRKGDYKLIKWYGEKSAELYCLANDIGEMRNLADSLTDKVLSLNDDLFKILIKTGSVLPVRNPTHN